MARERTALLQAAGHLPKTARRLYERWMHWAEQDTGVVKFERPTRKLAAEMGVGVTTIETSRRLLVQRGLVVAERSGNGQYAYRVVVPAALKDRRRYPQRSPHRFRKRRDDASVLRSPNKGPRARSDSPRDQLHPSPTASPRESCQRHPDKPGKACRACGTSPRQRAANPRASGSNPRAGYVTPIPPRFEPAPAGVAPPPGLLDRVRKQLATRTSTDRRPTCTA